MLLHVRYLTLKLTNGITCRSSFHLKGIFVSVSVAYFFSLNSPWIVRRSSSEHRQTNLISIVGRSAFKQFDFFLECRLEDTDLWGSNDLCGRFWQIGWSRTDRLRISLNIYRLSVDKRRPDGRPNVVVVFVNELKQYPRGHCWIFSNYEIVMWSADRQNQTGSMSEDRATTHRLINTQTSEYIGGPRN